LKPIRTHAVTAKSDLVIVTAGVAQRIGESRLALIERNVAIMKSIIPRLLEHSPNTPICIVSNPCDIMTAVAAKVAGPSIPLVVFSVLELAWIRVAFDRFLPRV
jgi:L-lactate dehydrogenase